MQIAWLYWNPSRDAFTIPFIDRPVAWYGILFALGFICAYFLVMPAFTRLLEKSPAQNKPAPAFLADRLCWFLVIGTLVGARLGAIFFYDWDFYSQHPSEMIKVWNGGLASHGGIIGILLALMLYKRYVKQWLPTVTYLELVDLIAVPSVLVGAFIRLGNFINQEIVGTPSIVPWAVIFGDPLDGSEPLPRHPVQLYEGIAYFFIFLLLALLEKRKGAWLKPGTLTGWVLLLVFSSRFALEFLKSEQGSVIGTFPIQMGQLLSLPFIALGLLLLMKRAPHHAK